jgi:hypothetical protein
MLLVSVQGTLRFRFRYILHPWTAKYSHWMWHWAIAFCQSYAIGSAKWNISHLEYSVVSLISGQHPSRQTDRQSVSYIHWANKAHRE